MKIAFDIQPILNNEKSGVGYCQYGFIKTLLNNYSENEYVFHYFGRRTYNEKIQNLFQNQSTYQVNHCSFVENGIYKVLGNILMVPYKGFFADKVDITHFFNYYIPPGVNGKKIVTVHDMAYKRFPETVRLKTKKMLDINLKKSMSRADIIITDSNFSKSEILSYFPVFEDKIKVVYCGVDLNIFRPVSSTQNKYNILQKYKIPHEYLLYLGTIEPRKNIKRLIESYDLLSKEMPQLPQLVLAGGRGWLNSEIFNTVKQLKLESKIIFTGYIDDTDISEVVRNAKAFLFPSLYEGFGMPPLEAMACGVPVLTSNVASLPEVVGDAAVLIDPFSIESIKYGMKKILTDHNLRNHLVIKGPKRAKLFSWDHVTSDLYNIYEELMLK